MGYIGVLIHTVINSHLQGILESLSDLVLFFRQENPGLEQQHDLPKSQSVLEAAIPQLFPFLAIVSFLVGDPMML